MKAVILARGLGKRMREASDALTHLTGSQQAAASAGLKAMMPITSRPFLDYALSSLADAGITDVALIIGPEHDAIRRYYRDDAPPARVRVTFVEQPEPIGTADAVRCAEEWVGDDPFLVLNADNLYPADALDALVALDGPGLPVFERDALVSASNIPADRVASFALLEVTDGRLARIVEKPGAEAVTAAGPHALVSMNIFRFDARIFDACRDVPRSARGEFELPAAVSLAVSRGVRFSAVPAWGPVLDLSRQSDIAEVERRLANTVPRP